GLLAGGLNTQEAIFHARKKVAIGVCTREAASVPTTTMTKAALPTSAPALLPFRIAPPMIDMKARTMPMMLKIPMTQPRGDPPRQPRPQAHQRLTMDLAYAGF